MSRWAQPSTVFVAGPGELDPLDEAACWVLLHRAPVGRVALGRADGTALVRPVSYAVSGRSVRFRTSAVGFVEHLGGRASFQVDGVDKVRHVEWSVLLDGAVAFEEDGDEVLVRIAADEISGSLIRQAAAEWDVRGYR